MVPSVTAIVLARSVVRLQVKNPMTALRTFGKLLLRRLPQEDILNRELAKDIILQVWRSPWAWVGIVGASIHYRPYLFPMSDGRLGLLPKVHRCASVV